MTKQIIGIWLLIGLGMVFIQVILGGITRLTGSGLSITKWEIITGTYPPLNNNDWQEEFEKYKQTPQYKKINQDMDLQSFKYIYFWEYLHRLWARLMGLVFAIPLGYFLFKGMVTKKLLWQLVVVVILASAAAGFGWIMVQSGLVDKPWVSPFKLTIHLGLAIVLFVYLAFMALTQLIPSKQYYTSLLQIDFLLAFIIVFLVLQLALGGMMSGMKAGLNYPTFPTMNGEWIPYALDPGNWSWQSFINYDSSTFASSFVQFFHRLFAIILVILISILSVKLHFNALYSLSRIAALSLFVAVLFQFGIGIITLLNSQGQIPVFWGVLHQAFALILIFSMVLNIHLFRTSANS